MSALLRNVQVVKAGMSSVVGYTYVESSIDQCNRIGDETSVV